jgi:hypothetical protein
LKTADVYPIQKGVFENYKFPVPNNIEQALLNTLPYGKKLGVNFNYLQDHHMTYVWDWYNNYQILKEKVKETNIFND